MKCTVAACQVGKSEKRNRLLSKSCLGSFSQPEGSVFRVLSVDLLVEGVCQDGFLFLEGGDPQHMS